MNKMLFNLVTVVFNKKYIDFFLNVTIPNLLAKENIPKCSKRYLLTYSIYTTEHEKKIIQNHKNIKILSKIIPITINPIITPKLLKKNNKYNVKGLCQSHAIKKAIHSQVIIALINPDSLLSNGGLFNCFSLIEKGKKAVLIGELARVEKESVMPKLEKYYNEEKNSLTINSKDLVEIGINTLHPIGKILFWREKIFSKWPSCIYWKIGKNSLLAKFFHLHPLAIDFRNLKKKIPNILMPDDGGLIEFLGFLKKDIYVVENSNKLACIEISDKSMNPLSSIPHFPKNKVFYLLSWALKNIFHFHRKNFCDYNLCFQGNEKINWTKEKKLIKKELFFIFMLFKFFHFFNFERLKFLGKKIGLHKVRRFLLKKKKI